MPEQEASHEKDNYLKLLMTYLPLFSLMAYLFGAVRLQYFYSLFNFNALSYFEFGEILMQAFSDALTLIIFLFVLVGIIGVSLFFKRTPQANPNRPPLKLLKPFKVRLGEHIITFTIIIAVFSLLIIRHVFGLFYSGENYEVYYSNLQDLIIELSGIVMLVSTQLLKKAGIDLVKNRLVMSFILGIISLMVYAVIFSTNAIIKIRFYHTTTGTSITTDKSIITSTKVYYYIGRSKDYIFFYDEKKKAVDVFPSSEVKKATIKELF
jgi:magnesium-transporting ATPase (P-type)